MSVTGSRVWGFAALFKISARWISAEAKQDVWRHLRSIEATFLKDVLYAGKFKQKTHDEKNLTMISFQYFYLILSFFNWPQLLLWGLWLEKSGCRAFSGFLFSSGVIVQLCWVMCCFMCRLYFSTFLAVCGNGFWWLFLFVFLVWSCFPEIILSNRLRGYLFKAQPPIFHMWPFAVILFPFESGIFVYTAVGVLKIKFITKRCISQFDFVLFYIFFFLLLTSLIAS